VLHDLKQKRSKINE